MKLKVGFIVEVDMPDINEGMLVDNTDYLGEQKALAINSAAEIAGITNRNKVDSMIVLAPIIMADGDLLDYREYE